MILYTLLLLCSFITGFITDFIWTKLVVCINHKEAVWAANYSVMLYLSSMFATYLVIEQNYPALALFLVGGWLGTYFCVKYSE